MQQFKVIIITKVYFSLLKHETLHWSIVETEIAYKNINHITKIEWILVAIISTTMLYCNTSKK